MHYLKIILGSFLFGLGTMGTVWFLRNLFQRRMNQALFYQKTNPFIIIIWNIILIIGGLGLYSDFDRIPIIALLLGLIIGWSVSR